MNKHDVALAMYTIHREVEQPGDLRVAFLRLGEMGYRGVEFYGSPQSFAPALVREALADASLRLTGWHVEWSSLQPDTIGDTAALLGQAGCPVAIISCLGGKHEIAHTRAEECREVWERYAAGMNRIAAQLAGQGIRLGYHSHDHEFRLRYDGKCVHEILFGALDPAVIMELDSGCCIQGGGDPAAVIRRNRGRDMFLHLKPYSRTRGFDILLGDEDDAHDWPGILAALDDRCLGLLVENGSEAFDGFELAEGCLAGLRRFL